MPYSIISLTQDRKNDMVFILGYFLYLQTKPNPLFKPSAAVLKTTMATVDKVRAAQTGKRLDFEVEEFAAMYTAAQYTVQLMASPGGLLYLNQIFANRRTEEWKKEMTEYFRDTCMYYINECNSKYAHVPEFAMLRAKVEEEIRKGAV